MFVECADFILFRWVCVISMKNFGSPFKKLCLLSILDRYQTNAENRNILSDSEVPALVICWPWIRGSISIIYPTHIRRWHVASLSERMFVFLDATLFKMSIMTDNHFKIVVIFVLFFTLPIRQWRVSVQWRNREIFSGEGIIYKHTT